MNGNLLSEIELFLADTNMASYTFGMEAVSNGRLVERLRNGGRIWPDTEEKVRAFMDAKRQSEAAQ